MSTPDSQAGKVNILAVVIPILFILIPLGYSAAQYMLAERANGPEPFLERAAGESQDCVRDTTYMRHHHWQLLLEIREEFVRYGKRGEVCLSKCGECHKSRERFCDRCHNAVSLMPDCFGCHYYP